MRTFRTSGFALISAFLASGQTAHESELEFSADRPGFSTAPSVLPRGLTQIEAGATFSVDREGNRRERNMLLGNPLLRYGVGRSTEVRISGDGYRLYRCEDSGGPEKLAGLSDLAIGAKIAMAKQGRILPAVSLLPSLSLPSGHKAFTSSRFDPSVAVAWQRNFSAGLWVGGTFSSAIVSEQQARHSRYASAISLGVPVPARLSGFVEAYALQTGRPWGPSIWMSAAGVSRMIGSSFQIDVSAGRRMAPAKPCWFLAAGFALRHASPFARKTM